MELTTRGRYRVLGRPRDPDELLLVELDDDSFDPTYVRTDGYEGSLDDEVGSLRPGYVVEATLSWDDDGTPAFDAVSVERRSLVEFVDDVTGLFEAARETWNEAVAAGEGMNSRTTRDTDGRPNGALYVFAEQPGARDLFDEFRSGVLPLEPLVARVNEERGDDDPREMFVMRPDDGQFVVVYIVFEKEGMLANTMRETYDCPR
ncbi:hypothetical protein AUR64_06930 [Haloprofundus marisrubri]|uniref:Uncharacterized protein n=1 Tax=Haloprofundus marisrubri TaxID=1514971 RepID=A0A0W1RBZ7_9EURY|nr:DUF6663 family protein [Haloprofundus marisrubri]KTG10907.1 hypothetical protein AUR64_06930 [Haloprofundus marisrubri]